MASADINSIPYDAPLSIEEPSFTWVVAQNKKGANGSTLSVPEEDLKSVQGKWIIISGANNGIGREAAIAFARNGANLVLACRNPPPHETHPDAVVAECIDVAKQRGHYKTSIEWWELDSSKLSTVEAFCTRWLDTGRALDILCNNAGIGSSPGGNKVFKTEDGFEIVHQVNLLSHVLITLRLLPSLAKAPEPRVVCTTSCFHYLGKFNLRNFNGGNGAVVGEGVQLYQNNKLYFQVWLTELQRRLLLHPEYKHITVNGVHPGYVNSGIWNVNSNSLLTPVISSVLKTMSYFLGITPQQGSLCLLHAATSLTAGPDPEVQGAGVQGGKGGGRYFNRIWEEEPMPHTKDADCRMRVWRKVNDELKLQEKGLLDVLGLWFEEEPIKAQL